MRNGSKPRCGFRLDIWAAAVLAVCWPCPEAAAQDPGSADQQETASSGPGGTPIRFSLEALDRSIGFEIEEPLAKERGVFSDLLRRLEAGQVLERCDPEAMNEIVQQLIDLYGRGLERSGAIDRMRAEYFELMEDIMDFREEALRASREVVGRPPDYTEGARADGAYAVRLKDRLDQLGGEQRDLSAAVRAKLNEVINEYLRRCCGKERCGDSSRPSTGDASGRQGDSWTPGSSSRPRETGRSGGDDTGWPGGPRDAGGSGGTSDAWQPAGDTGPRTANLPIGGDAPGQSDDEPGAKLIGQPRRSRPATTPQPAPTWQPPTIGTPPIEPEPPGIPQPPETDARPPTGTTTGIPPQTGSGVPLTQAKFCCESCPGNDRTRFYFPIPPETDCQPGDVRRENLPYPQCPGNLFTEEPGPSTYGEACCAKKTTQLLYDSAKSGGVNSEVGSALRAACEEDPCAGKVEAKSGAPMRLETSVLSSGTDVQGRNWVPENPVLRLGKERLKPCHTEPFYVTKESSTNAAAVVLTAISADYTEDAQTAETSKGTACTASHSGASNETRRRDTPQERAVKAAAIGLLTSQAKGQLEGLRATFDVTGRDAQLKDAKLQADVVNEVTQRKTSLSLPVRFDTSER